MDVSIGSRAIFSHGTRIYYKKQATFLRDFTLVKPVFSTSITPGIQIRNGQPIGDNLIKVLIAGLGLQRD